MNPHALGVLEFQRVLELVARRSGSPLGREAVLELRPGLCREELARELGRVGEAMAFLEANPGWRPPEVPDGRAGIRRLGLEGGILEPVDLHRIGGILASSRKLKAVLEGKEAFPGLLAYRSCLHSDQAREEAIGRAVDRDGQVLDSASTELGRIRRELRSTRSRIVEKLEAYQASLPGRYRVPDASVSIRNGRYVVPIRKEGKSEVGGIVHGESASGATLFVEPPLALELMNRVGELERREEREVREVLVAHSQALRPVREALEDSLDVLVAFDSLHARADTALDWGAAVPELLDPGDRRLVVVRGRHPLLLANDEGRGVVPFDLTLDPDERVLVVSGPNTGGKTVFLKALGLLSALTQAGVVPPVGPGTRLPVFRNIFADIGDEQSIAESLSTFSAHLENLKEIVREAGPDCLVLIDEVGTGTDPTEGAALARAILETLVARGALSAVTSHLGQLKRLDREGSGIVNASLQFDGDRMEPTYSLVKGRPGRSYGLAIARRLGLPEALLDRAHQHISSGEASVEELLEKLQRKEKEAAELVASLEMEKEETARLDAELQRRERELQEAERSAERRARESARRLLMEARQEVEEAIQEVKEAAPSSPRGFEDVSRRARRKVEKAARRQRERKPPALARGTAAEVEPGQVVRLADTGSEGKVLELRDQRALVEVSGLKMEVPLAELDPLAEPAARGGAEEGGASAGGARGGWTAPAMDVAPEVDLRGLRVDEVELELGRALDRAVLGDLAELRIIHGKGTGALRARVSELLAGDGRVQGFRGGRPGEGGAGVTVASLS